jgi:hypothetical protein
MELVVPSDYVELIGHEFEHAIEQAEGVDLRSLVESRGGAAYITADGAFETARAVRVGRIVAEEFYTRK